MINKFKQQANLKVIQFYGLTEAASLYVGNIMNDYAVSGSIGVFVALPENDYCKKHQ